MKLILQVKPSLLIKVKSSSRILGPVAFAIIFGLFLSPLTFLALADGEEAKSSTSSWSCSSQVSYSWKSQSSAKSKVGDSKVEHEVFDRTVKVIGEGEKEAKDSLKKRILVAERQALEKCSSQHENFARCYASRLKSLSAALRIASFEGRKLLEESIERDCQLQNGLCVGTKSSAASCQELKSEDEGTEVEGDKEEGKEE